MSNESHPSSSGSSSFAGGTGVNEQLNQPSPAKPTWAQILNSNPNASSNNSSTTTNNNNNNQAPSAPASAVINNSSSSSSSPSSQQSMPTKTISPSASGTLNIPGSRTGYASNFYDQQQQQQQWPSNFNQTSSWIMNDDNDSQRQANNSSQQSMDNNNNNGGDGFDRLESSSPTSDWKAPVNNNNNNNSTSNGWSNFQQQQQQPNPSRTNVNNNQWPEINNFYGTNSFQNADNSNSSTTWQDPNSNDTHNAKTKSSIASSLTGALKSAIALTGNTDLLTGNTDTIINYIPQPKLVEQLGWDEPDINVKNRSNFDDGTSIWGDPMESMSIPVKKWTNGTKAALTNSTNLDLQQPPPQQQQQQIVQKPIASTPTTSMQSRSGLNDENWPKQQSPNVIQQSSSSSQWNDSSSTSLDQNNAQQQHHQHPHQQQQQVYRSQSNNWNAQSQQSDDWFRDGVVDTSDWGLQGPPHKTPFDPSEGQVDTSNWGVQSAAGAAAAAGLPGQMPLGARRQPFMNEPDLNEYPHNVRMSNYDDPYRQNPDMKNSMMPLSTHHPFPPRPGSLYPHQPGNILRQINPNSGLSTPPGAIIGQSNLSSPKLSSPVPTNLNHPYKQSNPSSSQTPPIPSTGNGNGNGNNNPNSNAPNSNTNNGAIHAQIMEQFRLAVQAGLISQDLLNTKLPPYMLQLLQKLFELQQKFQQLSLQLSDLTKNKGHFPLPILQNEYERLTKLITQKKQEMLIVQKEIRDAHNKLKQSNNTNGPSTSTGQNSDQSRLTQWTKQSTIGGQRTSMFPPPPGLSQKDWTQSDNNDTNDNWDNSQANESNNNNQVGNIDPHTHNNQSSAFSDPFSNLVDDIEGPPPFVPGQLWNWKSSPNAEDDPHTTPTSFNMGPKGPISHMGNLNVGGGESAFSNPQLMHPYQRQLPPNRSQWQHEPQGFQPPMNDWSKQQQYRGTSKAPPPPHPSFGGGGGGGGGYRPYM